MSLTTEERIQVLEDMEAISTRAREETVSSRRMVPPCRCLRSEPMMGR